MHFNSGCIFKAALFCFAIGTWAKDVGKGTDHDDSLDLKKPGPATIHLFTEHKRCNNATLQKKTSYDTDRCYNINPRFIKEFTLTAQPICKNGTAAEFTAFEQSNCWGDKWFSWEVTENHLDNCLRTNADDDEEKPKKLMSFALVCDGIQRRNSKLRLVATLLLLFGLSLAVLGLLLACIRGALVLASKTLGSLTWVLQILGEKTKVSLQIGMFLNRTELTTAIGSRSVVYWGRENSQSRGKARNRMIPSA
jgi:hypothetical protein